MRHASVSAFTFSSRPSCVDADARDDRHVSEPEQPRGAAPAVAGRRIADEAQVDRRAATSLERRRLHRRPDSRIRAREPDGPARPRRRPRATSRVLTDRPGPRTTTSSVVGVGDAQPVDGPLARCRAAASSASIARPPPWTTTERPLGGERGRLGAAIRASRVESSSSSPPSFRTVGVGAALTAAPRVRRTRTRR